MLLFRRAEASHKLQAAPTADTLARIMKDYLEFLPKHDGRSLLIVVLQLGLTLCFRGRLFA
jgi:hypothetical protein